MTRFLHSLKHRIFMEQNLSYHLNLRVFKTMTCHVASSLVLWTCSHPSVLFSIPTKSPESTFPFLHHSLCPRIPPYNDQPRNWTSNKLSVWHLTKTSLDCLWAKRMSWTSSIWAGLERQEFTNVRLLMEHRNDNMKILLPFISLPVYKTTHMQCEGKSHQHMCCVQKSQKKELKPMI